MLPEGSFGVGVRDTCRARKASGGVSQLGHSGTRGMLRRLPDGVSQLGHSGTRGTLRRYPEGGSRCGLRAGSEGVPKGAFRVAFGVAFGTRGVLRKGSRAGGPGRWIRDRRMGFIDYIGPG